MFKSYKDYSDRLDTFLAKNDLTEKYEQCRISGIETMISKFDMSSSEDMKQLAFLMWMSKDDFEILLNTYRIPIDLEYVKKMILSDIPCAKMTGRLEANFNKSLPFYDWLKFVGQYTNSQTIYNECLDILYAMPEKLEGLILHPPQVAHLMSYNKHVDTSNNKYKEENKDMLEDSTMAIDKLEVFNHAIYQPRPVQSRQYERYKTEIEKIYCDMTNSETDTVLGCICFANFVLRSVSFEFDIERVRSNSRSNLSNVALETIRQHLQDVSQCEPKINPLTISEQVEETLRFLTKENEKGIDRILSHACIYLSDRESGVETLEKRLLIEIYERQITTTNSRVTHNFIRMVAEYGRLWIAKFLIEKRCSFRNLPKYGTQGHSWVLENKQVKEILEEEVKDYWGFGAQWKQQRIKDKRALLVYLSDNKLL